MGHLPSRIHALTDVAAPLQGFYVPATNGAGYVLATSPTPLAARDASLAAALGDNPTPPTPAPSNPGAAPTAKPPLRTLNTDELRDAIGSTIPPLPAKPKPEDDDAAEDWGGDRRPKNIRLSIGHTQADFEAALAEAERRGGRVVFAEESDAPPVYTPTANDIVVPTGCDQRAFERAVEEAYRKGGVVVFGPPDEPKPVARDDSRRNAQGDFERAVAKARAEGRDFDYAAHFAQENS